MLLEEELEEEGLPRTPQHISILTTEYIASGLDESEYSAIEAAEDTRIGEEESGSLILGDAVVRSVGRLQAPPRTFSSWRIPSLNGVVAILADDPPAQEALLEIWREYHVPFRVMLYAGPFLIEGTLFSDDEDPPEFFRQAFRPIEDAVITPLTGRNPEPLAVRLGLVNVNHIHGYNVERT